MGMPSSMNNTVNALEFARLAQSIQGEVAVAELSRLVEDLPEAQPGRIVWRVQGRQTAAGALYMDVRADGELQLECQRCLQPFTWTAAVHNELRLLASRSEIEAMDAREAQGDAGDEETILASARLDVLALVEDELILALPYVPTHDKCPVRPDPAGNESGDEGGNEDRDSGRPSPFAVLGQLRKH